MKAGDVQEVPISTHDYLSLGGQSAGEKHVIAGVFTDRLKERVSTYDLHWTPTR